MRPIHKNILNVNQEPKLLDEWDILIQNKSKLIDLKIKEIWSYRDLLLLFVKRDFISFYKQTILGPLWFFIQPVFTTIVYVFIFGNLAKISTDGIPQILFYMSGITAWNYFADCITKTSTVFRDNSNIFGKVYFPRLIIPLSIVVSNLLRFTAQFILFLLTLIYFKISGSFIEINYAIIFFPFLLLLMAMYGLGLGLLISAMTTKYRDLSFLVAFGIQLLMYATTVIYPLSVVPIKYRIIVMANPLTSIIELFRLGFLGKGYFSIDSFLYSISITIFIFLIGIIIFNKTEKTFIDTI